MSTNREVIVFWFILDFRQSEECPIHSYYLPIYVVILYYVLDLQ